MKKKVGILTYAYNNYGGCLQAYALQAYLKTFPGLEVCNIDLFTPERIRKERIFYTNEPNVAVHAATLLLTLLRYSGLRRRHQRIQRFKERYLSLKVCQSYEEIAALLGEMDVLVSGSDQVFNPVYPTRRIFYLDFPHEGIRKVAYAPSFGISYFSSETEREIAPWVRDFDALSCREWEGAEFLSRITGHDVPVLADPSLLLTSEEWAKVAVSPLIDGEYIFVYDLNGGRELIDIALKIKKRTGLPIVCQTQKVRKFYPIDRQIYDSGPAEFLGWIRHAAYVVTDSFHGTLFSALFQRRFHTYVAYPRTASRIGNLLSMLGCEDRIVPHDRTDEFRFDDTPMNIDHKRLSPLIGRSKDFIEQNIVAFDRL